MSDSNEGGAQLRVVIGLEAATSTEQRLLDYLDETASAVLREKINAGKKTLKGAVVYVTGKAQKKADGAGCVCIDDETVFGWVIHFFEEDSVKEPAKRAKVKLPGGVKKKATKKKAAKKKAAPKKVEPAGPIVLELFDTSAFAGEAQA